MTSKKTINVMSYETGDRLGKVERAESLLALYAECRHPEFQWPEGIARAISVLSPVEIERLGIDPNTTVWLDGDF